MPALYRLIATIALALIASAVPAQPPDTSRVDTVHTYDTIVVRHTTYILDSSSAIQKEVAELKGEFYEKAVDAVNRENSGLGTVFTMITILLAIIGGIGAYGGISAYRTRQRVDKEVDQIRDLRNQVHAEANLARERMERILGRAEAEGEKIETMSTEMEERVKRASASAAQPVREAEEKAAAGPELDLDEKLKLIEGAGAEKAVEEYEQLLVDMQEQGVALDQIPASLHKNIGLNYYRLERWEEAVTELKVFLKDTPTDGDALFAVGFALDRMKRFEEACAFWDRTTQADPDNAMALYNWGVDLSKMYNATDETNWLERAFEKYQKATEIKPDMHDAFNNWGNDLGRMFNATGDSTWLERAFEKFQKATAIKPDHHLAFYNWGVYLSRMYHATEDTKWLDRTFEKYEKATEIKPDYHEVFNNWGADLISMYRATQEGKWLKEAIEKSLRALEIAPDEKDQCYNLACAQALLGEKDDMISSLRQAIDYDDKYKKMAREDKDFEAYWDDPDFIALTKEDDEGESTD